MKNLKDILLHYVPVVLLGLGAVFGLTSEESNSLAQFATAIIGGVFGIMAIVRHYLVSRKKDKAA